jgi:DNA-binding beta-propeller fold protein YncE
MTVALRVLAALLVAVLIGCGGAQEPALHVSAVRHWPLPPAGASIPAPRAVAVGPEGMVHVLDTAGRMLVYDAEGNMARQWTMPESEVGTAEGLCVLPDGRVVVADTHYSRVIVFDRRGRELLRFGGEGTGPGRFIYPVAVAADEEGDLFVAEYGSNDRVQKFSAEGELLLEFGTFGAGAEQFQRPSGLAWHDGRLYVADAMNGRVQVFTADGRSLGVLGGEEAPSFRLPYDIAVGPQGDLYVVEYGAGRVSRVTAAGRLVGRWGAVGHAEGRMHTPWGLDVTPDGRVLVADTGNRRIVELLP